MWHVTVCGVTVLVKNIKMLFKTITNNIGYSTSELHPIMLEDISLHCSRNIILYVKYDTTYTFEV